MNANNNASFKNTSVNVKPLCLLHMFHVKRKTIWREVKTVPDSEECNHFIKNKSVC